MRDQGKLDRRADPDELATATMAAIQGGLLLTQIRRDPDQLAVALDAAYAHLRRYAAGARDGRAAG
jgi:TetR/AcrR family transcriptional repressor of nem operon